VIWSSRPRAYKKFKGHAALGGLNLEGPPGASMASSSENGAERQRPFKLLMGFLKLDGGDARVLGMAGWRRRAASRSAAAWASFTEEKDLYPYMTVAQIIRFTRSFFPKWRDDI